MQEVRGIHVWTPPSINTGFRHLIHREPMSNPWAIPPWARCLFIVSFQNENLWGSERPWFPRQAFHLCLLSFPLLFTWMPVLNYLYQNNYWAFCNLPGPWLTYTVSEVLDRTCCSNLLNYQGPIIPESTFNLILETNHTKSRGGMHMYQELCSHRSMHTQGRCFKSYRM